MELLRSRPLRARGLKLIAGLSFVVWATVAPLAGAWIETKLDGANQRLDKGRAPCGRVD